MHHQKKLPLHELKGLRIPNVSLDELMKYHDHGKDGPVGPDVQGCHIITFAGRYATEHELDYVKVSSHRFSSSSSFEYCDTVIIINSTLYEIPKELRTATSRMCKHRNIHYAVISKKILDEHLAQSSVTAAA